MDKTGKIVLEPSYAQITEKKSRFIAACRAISCEEDAAALIAQERKQYFDARHVCFAWVCGDNNEITRFSDDGEPRGTAGKPILDVICAYNLKNALITVTRYFGGTLLGTGGLVRAYTCAAQAAVEAGIQAETIAQSARGALVRVTVSYKDSGKLEHMCRTGNILINEKEFGADVTYTLLVREEKIERLSKDIADLTNAAARITCGPAGNYIFS